MLDIYKESNIYTIFLYIHVCNEIIFNQQLFMFKPDMKETYHYKCKANLNFIHILMFLNCQGLRRLLSLCNFIHEERSN